MSRLRDQATRCAKHLFETKRYELIESGRYSDDDLPKWEDLPKTHAECPSDAECTCQERKAQHAERLIRWLRHDDIRDLDSAEEAADDDWVG